jgi:type IV fimbrial biogenesis protein FimT
MAMTGTPMNFRNRQTSLKKSYGVTIIELFIGLVIISIGLTVAVPGFQKMIARNSVATTANEMLLAINLARSEASRTGAIVSIQAEDGSDSGNEFGPGWCVIRRNPGNCDGAIRKFAPLVDNTTLNFVDAGGATSIRFTSLGSIVDDVTVSLDLCVEGQSGRRIFISPIGRSKSYRVDSESPLTSPQC